MCLYVKNRNQGRNQCVLAPETAKKPIPCFKVVLKVVTQPYKYDENIGEQFRDYEKVEYVSPWRREPWHDRFTYSIGHVAEHNPTPLFGPSRNVPLRAERHYYRGENEGYNYTVDPGIHTWNAKSPGAEKYMLWLKEQLVKHSHCYPYCCATPVILECEIPAGTRYYRGIAWADDKVRCAGYASERVKVIKEREMPCACSTKTE